MNAEEFRIHKEYGSGDYDRHDDLERHLLDLVIKKEHEKKGEDDRGRQKTEYRIKEYEKEKEKNW